MDDCVKDGGQEFFMMLCITLNFDRFDWLISSILQRILVKNSSRPSLAQSSVMQKKLHGFDYMS